MLMSAAFLIMLISTLYHTSNTLPTENAEDHVKFKLEQKVDALLKSVNQVDISVQQLQEKSNTWSIFRHNIEAWNEQMKAIEHKLSLIQRTQEEQQHKLTSLEFTLNHVLSKVIFLSDTDVHAGPTPQHNTKSHRDREVKEQKPTHWDKQQLTELSTRLNNVLRHFQNFESKKCRQSGSHDTEKPSKLMLPINANDKPNTSDLDRMLRKLDQKLNILLANLQPKDLKHMQSQTKKNAKSLESILQTLIQMTQQQSTSAKSWDHMTDYCQSVSGELTTFTESSDLLLKRIEIIVKELNERLKSVALCTNAANDARVNGTIGTGDHATEHPPAEEEHPIQEESDETVEHIDNTESDEHVEVVEFVQPTKSDCYELEEPRIDGIYKFLAPELNEAGRDFNERFCAFATDGQAWTVIQNRGPYIEQENFNRSWADYRNGFGSLAKDFWFGLEFTHILSSGATEYTLRIELEDFEGKQVWAEYDNFRLDDGESYNYNLNIGTYRGSIPDAMQYHNEIDFSTFDRQNDHSKGAACAVSYGSGWWFDNCSETNLNGIYRDTPTGHNYVGIIWEHYLGDYSLKATRMLIRPRSETSTEESLAHNYNELTDM